MMRLIGIYYNALYDCTYFDEFVELYKIVAEDDRVSTGEFRCWEREYNRIIDEKLGKYADN